MPRITATDKVAKQGIDVTEWNALKPAINELYDAVEAPVTWEEVVAKPALYPAEPHSHTSETQFVTINVDYYTLALTDDTKLLFCMSTSPNQIRVPANSARPFPVGTVIRVAQMEVGQTEITNDVGVSIYSQGGDRKILGRYCEVTLTKIATNVWLLTGQLLPGSAPPVVTADPVAHWSMNGHNAGVISDSTPNALHATLATTANVSTVTGQFGDALQWSGTFTNRYAVVPHHPKLNFTTGLSIACWVKVNGTTGVVQRIVGKGTRSVSDGYELTISTSNKVLFWMNSVSLPNSEFRLDSVTSVPVDGSAWTHVAATYDGEVMKIYLNGVLDATKGMSGAIITNGDELRIASRSDDSGKLHGAVDELYLFGYALSQSQVTALKNTNTAPSGSLQAPNVNPLTFHESFEGKDLTTVFPGQTHQFTVNQPYAFQVVNNPYGLGQVGRFELRQGDASQSGGTRSEALFNQPSGSDIERWYSFKYYLPSQELRNGVMTDTWKNDNKQDIITQWHQGSSNPPLSIRMINSTLRLDTRSSLTGTTQYYIQEGGYTKDAWVHLVFHVRFVAENLTQENGGGFVRMYRNGVLVCEHLGPTMFSGYPPPRWKVGIYKSDWNSGATTNVTLRVAYFDEVKWDGPEATLEDM